MTLKSRSYRWLPIAGGVTLGVIALAQPVWPSVVILTPAELKWELQGGLTAPGVEQLNLVGDPAKPGPYTIRLKFPKGFRIAPHTHPDSREVTILTGYSRPATARRSMPRSSRYCRPAASTPNRQTFLISSRSTKKP